MQTGLTNDRTFVGAYDSVAQGWLAGEWDDETVPARRAFEIGLARLRLETLLARTLVLTDTQVFDGALLRGLAGQGLLEALAAEDDPLPVEIRSRDASLEMSLWRTWLDADGKAVGFLPSGLSQGLQLRQRILREETRSSAPGLAGVVELLGLLGTDAAELGAAEAGWRRTLELEHRLTVVPWTGGLQDHWVAAQSMDPVDYYEREVLTTQEGRALLQAVQAHGTRRGKVYEEIEQLHRHDGDAADDARWVRHWYDGVYQRAQAFQHGADYRSSEPDELAPLRVQLLRHRAADDDKEPGRGGRASVVVEMPPGTLSYLAEVSAAEWGRFRSKRLEWLELWWSHGDVDALRHVLDDVVKQADLWSPAGPPADASRVKSLSSGRAARELLRYGTSAATSLLPYPLGPALDLALNVRESLGEAAASGPAPRIELTDYFDEVV